MAPCQSHPSHGQSGKSRVAPKTSKTTTAWWLVSKWHSMPLVMKCRIKNQKGRASPTQTWIALGKQLATYSLAASLFCTQSRSKLILHPASCWQSQSCDSLQHSHPSGGQNQCGSEEEQNYRCMVAGVPLEEYAIGQMSNQQ